MEPLRAFFEQLALEWDASQPPDRNETLNLLLEPFDPQIRESDAILDIGTGTGAIIPILRSRYPAATIFSIDLATEMLLRARRRVRLANLAQANVHQLPFVEQSFSTVICHNSFPHFWGKEQALSEIKRVMRAAGCLFILHDLGREQVNAIHQGAQSEIIHRDLLPPGETLRQMLNDAGFHPTRIEDLETHFIAAARVNQ